VAAWETQTRRKRLIDAALWASTVALAFITLLFSFAFSPPGTGSFPLADSLAGRRRGRYLRLTLQAQPTVRPVRAEIAIRAPDGMGVVATNAPLRVRGGLALGAAPLRGR